MALRRRRAPAAIAALVALVGGVGSYALVAEFAGAAGVTTPVQTVFELDGDPTDSGTGKPQDWSTLLSSSQSSSRVDLGDGVFRIANTPVPMTDPEETDTSYYKGGGSKDERDVSGSGQVWLHSSNDVAPDKNSILNAAAAAYEIPDGPDGDGAGQTPETKPDLLMTFTLDRLANDGDAVAGFWFFKNRIGAPADSQSFTGQHAVGDVLVVSDFTNGGAVSKIRVYKWVGGSKPIQLIGGTESGDTPLLGGSVVQCGATDQNPYVCATVNRGATAIPTAWPYTPKSGAANTYPTGSFYEGAINISAIVPDSDECFASFLAMTRSSTSTTAQLKDFVLGDLPICVPSTTLTADPAPDGNGKATEVAVIGDTIDFDFSELNSGNVPLTNVKVTTTSDDCVAGAGTEIPQRVDGNGKNIGDTNLDGKLDPGESWKFRCSFSKSTAQVVSFDAIGWGTDPANRVVTFCTTSTTQICDAKEKATAMAAWIEPGTELAVSADTDLNTAGVQTGDVKQGDDVKFIITEKNDGVAPTGYESYLDLTSVAVTTDNTDCNTAPDALTRTTPADTTDQTLSQNEVWTYECTVDAPSDDFTINAKGTGAVLAGTPYARVVTYNFANEAACVTLTAVRFCDSEERNGATVVVISPSTRLDVRASALITYTFIENNNSTDAPLTPPTAGVRTSVITAKEGIANVCNATAIAYSDTGDTNGNGNEDAGETFTGDVDDDKILDPGESWTFTCQGTLAGPIDTNGSHTSTKIATGFGNGRDSTADGSNVTYCGTDTQFVTSEAGKVCDSDERDKVVVEIKYQPRGPDPS